MRATQYGNRRSRLAILREVGSGEGGAVFCVGDYSEPRVLKERADASDAY
jgi:hypothetical protein